MLEKRFVEKRFGELLGLSLAERCVRKCCREVLQRSVVEKCWRELLEKSVAEKCCREVL